MKRTPLYDRTKEMGGTFTDFHGFELPLYYSSIREEHLAVRKWVGIFDVSHMGNFIISGRGARNSMNRIYTNNFIKMMPHQLKYTHMLDEKGRIIDDMIGAMIDQNQYMVVPNASMIDIDLSHIQENYKSSTDVENLSDELAIIAVQGPKAAQLMRKITTSPLPPKFFTCKYVKFTDIKEKILVWRSGYTGEDGFEIMAPNDLSGNVWDMLFKDGKEFNVKPCGLGSRDTLRLEKAFLLSGQDFNFDRTPLETNCAWVVKWDHDFIGKGALEKQKEEGIKEKLVLIIMKDKGLPRPGYKVYKDGELIGKISSGTFIPGRNIGMGLTYVKKDYANVGEVFDIDIRGKMHKAEVFNPKEG